MRQRRSLMAVLLPVLLLTQWLASVHGIWHQADGRMGHAPAVFAGTGPNTGASVRAAAATAGTTTEAPHSLASLVTGHEAGSLTCAALDHLCHAAPAGAALMVLLAALPAAPLAWPALPVRPQAVAAAFQARAPPRLA